MNRKRLKRRVFFGLVLSASLWFCLQATGVGLAQDSSQAGSERSSIAWQTPATLRHIVGKEKGDLRISANGIEFQGRNGSTLKWAFLDVQTFRLSPRGLTIETYQNRKRHMPGVERYRFQLSEAVPPEVAAELAHEVQRPSKNAVPSPASQGIVISAHHRTLTGGSNGILRFRDDGIDYVSSTAGDSRSWRWADLETVSNPDPYHLFLFGYRDTYTFDLKTPIPRDLFERATDAIYAHNESIPTYSPGTATRPNLQGAETRDKR